MDDAEWELERELQRQFSRSGLLTGIRVGAVAGVVANLLLVAMVIAAEPGRAPAALFLLLFGTVVAVVVGGITGALVGLVLSETNRVRHAPVAMSFAAVAVPALALLGLFLADNKEPGRNEPITLEEVLVFGGCTAFFAAVGYAAGIAFTKAMAKK